MYYFWVRLLVRVNYEDKEWKGMTIPRGSMITSIASLAHDMHLSAKQVRTFTERLTKRKQIVVETTNKWTKITICKYEDYQGDSETKGQTKGEQKGKQNGNERATTKEDKKKEIKNTQESARARKDVADRLYSLYPASTVRKDGNRVSLKSSSDKDKLNRLLQSHSEEELEYTIKRYVQENNGPYLKMFSTFLNNLPDYSYQEQPKEDDRYSAKKVLGPEYEEWIKTQKGQEFNELFK